MSLRIYEASLLTEGEEVVPINSSRITRERYVVRAPTIFIQCKFNLPA